MKNTVKKALKLANKKIAFVGSVSQNNAPNIKVMLVEKHDGLKTFYFASNNSAMRTPAVDAALQRRRKIDPSVRNCIRNIEMCRNLTLLLQSFNRAVTNTLLIYSDSAYGIMLIYYNMVKDMSRRGDPAAIEFSRTLQPFFRRLRRAYANKRVLVDEASRSRAAGGETGEGEMEE